MKIIDDIEKPLGLATHVCILYTYTDILANAMTNGFSQACNACCSELAGTNI